MVFFVEKNGQLRTLKGVFERKSMLQEIQSIYISQNRLVEGKDYVRAEWLKADIPINAFLTRLPVSSKNFEFKRNLIQLMNSGYFETNDYSYYITDFGTANDRRPRIWNRNSLSDAFISSVNVGLGIHTIVANDDEVTISSTTNTASLPWYGSPNSIVFNNATNLNKNTIHLTSSIKVDGVVRYTPCQLLRDIPATLDANNIARNAGECGMVDSISGKFYGNVASSGSFTVENVDESGTVEDTRLHQIYRNKLVEGKDYLIGEQLATVTSGSSTGGGGYEGAKLSLPVDYQQFSAEFKLKPVSSVNLISEIYVTFISNIAANGTVTKGQSIRRYYRNKHIKYTTSGSSVDNLYDFGAIESDIIIQVTKSEVIVNGVSVPRVTSPNAPLCVIGSDSRALKDSNIIKVTQDDRIFVPCRLLRSIPRNLDAQCKSRQTGECGMIDLVSGRFYGNVAVSGAFSLAWDEWLKDCSIQIDMEQTLGITNYAPPTIIYKGRVDTTKLTSELIDFGFVKISNSQIVCNQQTWSFSNWGSNKWATIEVSYGGMGGCNVKVNGTDVGSQTEQVTGIFNPHIFLYDIVQLNKIDYTFYPKQSDTTYSVNIIFSRRVNERTGKQYMVDNVDGTSHINAD